MKFSDLGHAFHKNLWDGPSTSPCRFSQTDSGKFMLGMLCSILSNPTIFLNLPFEQTFKQTERNPGCNYFRLGILQAENTCQELILDIHAEVPL